MRIILLILMSFSSIEAKLPKHTFGERPTKKYNQFWFLYQSEKKLGQDEFYIRPFYSKYHENLSAHDYKTSLYPLYYSEKTEHWSKWTFFFIFSGDTTKHDDTGADDDFVISPMFQFGKGETEKDKYFAFFPFFGKIKSKLSWSEINFFLFPIYADWRHKEFKARSLIYPVFVYGSSDIRTELRIFPFYSRKSHMAKFEHNTVLWPFIQWGKDFLDKKEPTSYSLFFPFYNLKNSMYGNMKARAYLWVPILGSVFGYGEDKRTGEVDYNFLFYFFQYGYSNSRDYRKHIIFPFYGYSHFASKQFRFITPLYINLQTDTYGLKSDLTYLVPFFIFNKRKFIKEEREDSYFKFWPIFVWQKDSEGNMNWNIISPLPIRSETFERVWDPIFSLIEYKKMINGEKRFSLLMRLYTQRSSEKEFHLYIPLLLDMSLEEESNSYQFMYGLLGYKSSKEKNTISLFWFEI